MVEEIRSALDRGALLAGVPERVERTECGSSSNSREATDTMLAGSDPVAGALRKTEPPFLAKLARLDRDTPLPLEMPVTEPA